jgi:transposase
LRASVTPCRATIPAKRSGLIKCASAAFRAPGQIVEFLEHLLPHLPGKLLVIRDGLPGHRSHLVRDFVAGQKGRWARERLPSYAPELNPVEYLWGALETLPIAQSLFQNLSELSHPAIRLCRKLRRRLTLASRLLETVGPI